MLRNSVTRQELRESLEARRREVEGQFSKHAEDIRRRNSRPLDLPTSALSSPTSTTSSNPFDVGDYLYLQVILS